MRFSKGMFLRIDSKLSTSAPPLAALGFVTVTSKVAGGVIVETILLIVLDSTLPAKPFVEL